MKKITIMSLALVAGVATAVVAAGFLVADHQPRQVRAQWKNIYRTPGGLVAGADLIVVANHVAAVPGRIAGEGEDATPFTDNTFAIESVLRGDHNGSELVMEQTGGILPDGAVFDINDGGLYAPGATYLLFLKSKGDGTYYLINHQARYRVEDGILEGVDPTDPVVARFHGLPLDAGQRVIEKRVRVIE
ncbi:MAG TPA: hypothetical protein VJH03_05975 [Blastocatellia bacterium]|nr:hypothetical protein [Blastocatellia bacterium]